MSHYILLATLLALTACGTRGNLIPPPGPAPAPILDRIISPAAPAKPAPKQEQPADTDAARGDLNTATEAAK